MSRGRYRLGAAECDFDSDCGDNGVCAAGVCYTQAPDLPNAYATYQDAQGNTYTVNAAGIQSVTAPQPSLTWEHFKQWFSEPVAPGWFSNGTVVIGAGVLAALLSLGGKKRRRRR